MERAIDASVKETMPLPGASFEFEGVDCRTSTCLATVTWPSREAAMANLRAVSMVFGPSSHCSTDIALPPAGEKGGPLTSSVLLTCRGSPE
jgi:hypothetical protein